jgi:hypothetical protein
MPGPGRHWIAGAVAIHNAQVTYNFNGTLIAIVTEREIRRLIIRATNPQEQRTTVRLALQPETPIPGGAYTVSAVSLGIGPQQTGEFFVKPIADRVVLSVRLDSDDPIIPGGEVLGERTWNFRAGPEPFFLADSQPLVWYKLPPPGSPPT